MENRLDKLEVTTGLPSHPLLQAGSNLDAAKTVSRAELGDPEALKEILHQLSEYLEGQKSLSREFALFAARGFRELALSEAMTRAAELYPVIAADAEAKAMSEKPATFGVRKFLGLGPRLPEKQLREIGVAFRHAFRLRKIRGRRPTVEIVPQANPPHLDHPCSFQYLDSSALPIEDAARKGDPEALRLIWDRLAGHLLGEVNFGGGVYAAFCSRSLWAFTASSAVEKAEVAFEVDGKLEIDSGLPEVGDLRRLERAFCRAMHLAKPKGKDLPRDLVWMPPLAQKAVLLMLFGASKVEAIKIACSTGSKMTPSSLDEWLRLARNPTRKWKMTIGGGTNADPVLSIDDREDWLIDGGEPSHVDLDEDPESRGSQLPPLLGIMGAFDRLKRRFMVVKLVDEEMDKGADFPSACEAAGRRVVQELVGLSDAKVFLSASKIEGLWRAVKRCLESRDTG